MHPGATVVNLGCGLDTTFPRVDNGTLRRVDVDRPDVRAPGPAGCSGPSLPVGGRVHHRLSAAA